MPLKFLGCLYFSLMTIPFLTLIIHKQYNGIYLKSSWHPFVEMMWFLSWTNEDIKQQKSNETSL